MCILPCGKSTKTSGGWDAVQVQISTGETSLEILLTSSWMIATDHSKCTMHAVYLWHITWWHSMALCLYFYFLVEKVCVSVHKLRCFRITYIFFLNCSLLIQILHSGFIIDLMFVQPFPIVFIYRSPDPQSYGIRKWSLWGIISVRWDHESGAPMMRLESLYRKRKGHQNLLFLPCDNPLYSMKRALTKN